MVVFEGKLSGQALKNRNKKLRNETIIILSIISCIFVAIWYFIFGFSFSILIPIAVFAVVFAISLWGCNKSNTEFFRITVNNEEETVVYTDKKNEYFHMIKDVETVYDYGDYYHIFEAGDMFLCQKSLLVQGTIEEFEKIFDGKIIRKS